MKGGLIDAHVDRAIVGRWVPQNFEIRIVEDGLAALERNDRIDVDVAGLHGQHGRQFLGEVEDLQRVEIGHAFRPVVLVRDVVCVLMRHIFLEHEGSRADAALGEGAHLVILGQDRRLIGETGNEVGKIDEGLVEVETHVRVARLLDIAEGKHPFVDGAGRGADLGVEQALERRDHIIGRKRGAVVPFDALADGEDPGLRIGVGLPGGGKPRIERPILPRIAEIFEGWLIGEHLAGVRGGDRLRILARVLRRKAKRAAALGLLCQYASRARDPEGRERHTRHRG